MNQLGASNEPVSAPDDKDHLLGLYSKFIERILDQLDAISESLAEIKENPNHPSNWKNCDFSCFELRKSCEYLTLAIVLAHHCDGSEIDDLSKWRPKDLLAQVGKLSDHPTPIPISNKAIASDDRPKQIVPLSRPVRASEISAIYGQCSDRLHAGSLERILGDKLPSYDVAILEQWSERFRKLLEHHVLLLPGIKRVLLFSDRQFYVLGSDGLGVLDSSDLAEFELLT